MEPVCFTILLNNLQCRLFLLLLFSFQGSVNSVERPFSTFYTCMSDMFASKHLRIIRINLDELHGFISCGAQEEVQRNTEKYTNTLKSMNKMNWTKSGKKTAKNTDRERKYIYTLNSI